MWNIFDYIIVITTESSIINISESNTIFLRNKMYLLNLNFNKIGLIHYKKAIKHLLKHNKKFTADPDTFAAAASRALRVSPPQPTLLLSCNPEGSIGR